MKVALSNQVKDFDIYPIQVFVRQTLRTVLCACYTSVLYDVNIPIVLPYKQLSSLPFLR